MQIFTSHDYARTALTSMSFHSHNFLSAISFTIFDDKFKSHTLMLKEFKGISSTIKSNQSKIENIHWLSFIQLLLLGIHFKLLIEHRISSPVHEYSKAITFYTNHCSFWSIIMNKNVIQKKRKFISSIHSHPLIHQSSLTSELDFALRMVFELDPYAKQSKTFDESPIYKGMI